mmetsp:Transcript_26590/g.35567  ORF Transcript_26590/g.35567 Transcript_26590/m.35567 type:complete len:147 (+) Transcript_26590:99-539(+)
MASTQQIPSQLTAHGLKRICESTKLADDMKNTNVTLQVVEVNIFSAEKARKNIKGRVSLSDGVSRVICMLPEKTYDSMVSARHWSVIYHVSGRLPKAGKCASMTCGSSMQASSSAPWSAINRKYSFFYRSQIICPSTRRLSRQILA